jgi:hypothetical protein
METKFALFPKLPTTKSVRESMNVDSVPSPLTAVGVFMKNNKDVCPEEKPNLHALMDPIIAVELTGSSTLLNVKESPDLKLLTISLLKMKLTK